MFGNIHHDFSNFREIWIVKVEYRRKRTKHADGGPKMRLYDSPPCRPVNQAINEIHIVYVMKMRGFNT